jgi:hypothetical protein
MLVAGGLAALPIDATSTPTRDQTDAQLTDAQMEEQMTELIRRSKDSNAALMRRDIK